MPSTGGDSNPDGANTSVGGDNQVTDGVPIDGKPKDEIISSGGGNPEQGVGTKDPGSGTQQPGHPPIQNPNSPVGGNTEPPISDDYGNGTDYDAIRKLIEAYKQKINELEKLLPENR